MSFKPTNWSVVILGRWNRAILTPAGMAKRLFNLPNETPINIEVPIDGIGPYRVKNEKLIVSTDGTRLIIALEQQDYETLEHAKEIAIRALKKLPETPVSAAGFNIRFHSQTIGANLVSLTKSKIDELISDQDYTITTSILNRSLNYEQGHINLEIGEKPQGEYNILMNFERRSQSPTDLIEWLEKPMTNIEEQITKILCDILSITINVEEKPE